MKRKERHKNNSKDTITLNIWQDIIVIIIISVITTLVSIAIQPGKFHVSMMNIIDRPLTIVLNGFPVVIFVFIGYLIVNNVFYGAIIPSAICMVFSYINLLKIEGREDVFVPSDFSLFKEAFSAVKEYNLDMHPKWIVIMVVYILLLLVFGLLFKSKRVSYKKRIIFSVLSLFLFLFSMEKVYSSDALFYSFYVPETYNIPARFNTLGFNYCFLHHYNLYPIDKPDNYDKKEVEKWKEDYRKDKTEITNKPNVLMVMCEAFSDLANESVFAWKTEKDNPLYKYNLLAKSDQAITGHIIVSNIAAGTANTEFDVLTGMPTTMIGETTTSAFRVVNHDIATVASILNKNGYDTGFIHPGDSWFYNRSNVYRHFGIEKQVFKERFDLENDIWGSYISDKAFLRELKVEIESMMNPFFIYGVTIQNHQTYTYNKYLDKTEIIPTYMSLTDSSMEYLSVYMRGLKDSSDMLYELVRYIDEIDEPTILVFFGDHLPNLGANYMAYQELDLPVGRMDTAENILSGYQTTFMIYANKAYANNFDLQKIENELEFPQNKTINSIYLGAILLEMLGYEGEDSYFDFLNDIRRILPVFRDKEQVYMTMDGSYMSSISDELYADIIKKIDWWEYYRLKNH